MSPHRLRSQTSWLWAYVFSELFEQFVREKQFLGNVTPQTVRWCNQSWGAFTGAVGQPKKIDKQILNQFVIRMREGGLSAISCNVYICAINSFVNRSWPVQAWSGIQQRHAMLAAMPLALKTPYSPMEAISVSSIPESDGWQYEPKWDGFRCLAFKDLDKVELQSKSQKMLTAYFPEVVDALRRLEPTTFVLDGELVVPVNGELSFDHLLMRLSRAQGGTRKQAAEYPAVLFVFDLLADEHGNLLTREPLSERRPRLERFAETHLDDNGTVRLSPATTDLEVARKWLALAGGSLDGIVAKRLDLPYQPGISKGMQKIKRLRTVDCVVGGVILRREAVSHVLLGLYDEAGLLHFIGSAPLKAAEGKKLTAEIINMIQPPGFTGKQPGEVRIQFGHRIGEWHPLRPTLVAEVQYDHFTGGRFRHGAKFLRWRPDKEPEDYTMVQVVA